MLPHELIAAILKSRGLSPYATAKAMNRVSFQPTLHKFLHGQIVAPTQPTAKRIADFCGVPIEAIYDVGVATRLGRELGFNESSKNTLVPATSPAREPVPIHSARPDQHLSAATVARIAKLSARQFKSLNQMVQSFLDGVEPESVTQSDKQRAG